MEKSYVKAAIIGLHVGDALGYHYRFAKYSPMPNFADIDMLPGPQVFRQAGVYTNASALSLCTMATLNEYHELNTDDLLERFNQCVIGDYMNYDAEDYYLGDISVQAIRNSINGMPYDKCGIRTEEANDDDDIYLRILPVALWYAEHDNFLEIIKKTISLTHSTTTAILCGSLYAIVIRNLLLQKVEKIFDYLAQYYQSFEEELRDIKNQSNRTAIANAFWTAWKLFTAHQNDFKKSVKKAMRCPNPNVIGGILGTWTALQTGLDGIPSVWQQQLKLSGEVTETIEKFVQNIASFY